jgi:hypothetical protein
VHEVNDAQAAELAALSNLTSGKPYTPEERRQAIQAIRDAHPLAPVDEIARLANSSAFVTKEALAARDLERRNPLSGGELEVSDTVLRVIGRTAGISDEQKDQIVRAARKGQWTKDQARYAVQQIKDPDFTQRYKDDLLAARIAPLMVDKNQLAYVRDVLDDVPTPVAIRAAGQLPRLMIDLFTAADAVRQQLAADDVSVIDASLRAQFLQQATDLEQLAQSIRGDLAESSND